MRNLRLQLNVLLSPLLHLILFSASPIGFHPYYATETLSRTLLTPIIYQIQWPVLLIPDLLAACDRADHCLIIDILLFTQFMRHHTGSFTSSLMIVCLCRLLIFVLESPESVLVFSFLSTVTLYTISSSVMTLNISSKCCWCLNFSTSTDFSLGL